ASFSFTGTSVTVYGTVMPPQNGSAQPASSYVLDGGTPVSYVAPNVVVEVDGAIFFQQNGLSNKQHTLTINIDSASAAAPYLLDYIAYVP
ncbi:hypothetical protein B0H21DRAFT_660976, partial [Amylocystis lapponica]